jgi:PPOX class probable F420-dependent enzyme
VADRLDDARIQAFLATREVVVLATLKPGGAPTATAMWFLPDPDALTMISVEASAKVRNIRRDPRVCVLAETGTRAPDIRGVAVEGRAVILPDSAERRALADRLLDRYDPHLARLWGGRAVPANRVVFRIAPERVRAWGLA